MNEYRNYIDTFLVSEETEKKIADFYGVPSVDMQAVIDDAVKKAQESGRYSVDNDFEDEIVSYKKNANKKIDFIRFELIEEGENRYDDDGEIIEQTKGATFKVMF